MSNDFSNIIVSDGCVLALGAIATRTGVNFALFSKNAKNVYLCLFLNEKSKVEIEIALDEHKNRTGHIWHIHLENLPENFEYAYKIDGSYEPKGGHLFNKEKLLSDPYSKHLVLPHKWGEREKGEHFIHSKAHPKTCFDWEGTIRPNIPMHELIMYEMHVRGFTIDKTSEVTYPGTFRGVAEKIPYLKSLGINAVELMPIFEFDECHPSIKHPKTGKILYNYWGYSPINFFCPMHRFSSSSGDGDAIKEFKEMVREFHRNGIEVILDVVFNHTAEGGDPNHYLNFRGIDNSIYYMLDKNGNYLNFSGCGNTFNCNQYSVRQLILDSLRYWVSEMQVDGFRFDLASIMTRKRDGTPLPHPPLLIEICEDPILFQTKLIAEAWDAGGLYQIGHFPSWGRWSEWNGQYRDNVRRFIKGDPNMAGSFAGALCGSQHIYGRWHHPFFSINFITAHDGFTIQDLVSYNDKHNFDNGEDNRDGLNNNDSWNCGAEGETKDSNIIELRERQKRNFFMALLLAQGVPMLSMGDEYGHTRFGNNNAWNHDNQLNWFSWKKLEENRQLFHFVRDLINFRKNNPILRNPHFLKHEDIEWHGTQPLKPNWGGNEKLVAFTLKDPKEHHLYIAFNANASPVNLTMPPKGDKEWYRIVDSSLLYDVNFPSQNSKEFILPQTYTLPSYSALLAKLN